MCLQYERGLFAFFFVSFFFSFFPYFVGWWKVSLQRLQSSYPGNGVEKHMVVQSSLFWVCCLGETGISTNIREAYEVSIKIGYSFRPRYAEQGVTRTNQPNTFPLTSKNRKKERKQ